MKGEIPEADNDSRAINEDNDIQEKELEYLPGYRCQTGIEKSEYDTEEKIKDKCMSDEEENQDGLMRTTEFGKDLKETNEGVNVMDEILSLECTTSSEQISKSAVAEMDCTNLKDLRDMVM